MGVAMVFHSRRFMRFALSTMFSVTVRDQGPISLPYCRSWSITVVSRCPAAVMRRISCATCRRRRRNSDSSARCSKRRLSLLHHLTSSMGTKKAAPADAGVACIELLILLPQQDQGRQRARAPLLRGRSHGSFRCGRPALP